MTDYRGLGFDPTPGDADAVAEASRRCRTTVDVPGVPEGWAGAAAEGLATRVEAVVSELAAVRRAMRAAAEVLDAWAGALLGNRRRAEELDRRAVRLRRELADAADDVDHSGALASFTPAHAEAHAAAVARHDDLARRLGEVLDEARLLERDHHAEARRVADRLRSAERPDVVTDALADFSLAAEEVASVLFGNLPTARRPDRSDPGARPVRGAAAAFAAGLG